VTSQATRDRLPPTDPAPATYRAAMGRFPTGVALLAHGSAATLQAMTVNSVVSVSLDPLLLLVSVRTTSRMRRHLDTATRFVVHVLSAAQADMAALFARTDRPTGAAAARRLGAGADDLLLPGAVAAFGCVPHARHPAGDHVLYLGEVVALRTGPDEPPPLLFHRGGYQAVP
jgi:flavin reductase (DIM6/NTAB) family NADH-FMN oxidoreductase RutF